MKKLFLLSAIMMIYGWSASVSAKTWRVNNVDATAHFATLDAAMQGIAAGDTLYLEGSSVAYTLDAAITKKVAIIGPGYFLSENPNTLVNKNQAYISTPVRVMAKGTVLEGISLKKGASEQTLYIGADDITVRRCHLAQVYFSDDNNSTTIALKNASIIQCYIASRIYAPSNDYGFNAVIANNIFESASISYMQKSRIENNTCYSSFSMTNNVDCTILNNICANIPQSSNTNSTINNNYSAGTADYVSSTGASTDGKWKLVDTSAGMTAGSGGTQCGAFGGSSPYILSGLANVPHIYEIDAPASASAAGGLKVNIKIGTEK